MAKAVTRLDAFGSRKFIIWLAISVLSTVLLCLGKITDIVWAGLVGGESVAYTWLNVYQKKNEER